MITWLPFVCWLALIAGLFSRCLDRPGAKIGWYFYYRAMQPLWNAAILAESRRDFQKANACICSSCRRDARAVRRRLEADSLSLSPAYRSHALIELSRTELHVREAMRRHGMEVYGR